jgi:formate dehydrogenase iron-sulfur subunit
MDKVIAGDRAEANVELVKDLCEVMTDGSLCAMGGLTPMPVMSAINFFPEDFTGPGQQSFPVAAE